MSWDYQLRSLIEINIVGIKQLVYLQFSVTNKITLK